MIIDNKTIVVAMSGGVDSSTVAAILKEQKYQVIGITLKLYKNSINEQSCCSGQDIDDAKNAADKIGIPHYILNYEKLFKNNVINNFIKSYIKGKTPIPCIQCNQKIKFKDLLKVAQNIGAYRLATGHYIQKIEKNKVPILMKAKDIRKDQSYFLFNIKLKQLKFLEFPIGNLLKKETRILAKKYDLCNANKKDSQDICFIGKGGYNKFITRVTVSTLNKGSIVNEYGNILGKHNNLTNFTIGQRKKIGITSAKPLYVTNINAFDNNIQIGKKKKLYKNFLYIKKINWLGKKENLSYWFECKVKLRSIHNEISATIKYINNNTVKVKLKSIYSSITPGQACTIYLNKRIMGGGWIIK